MWLLMLKAIYGLVQAARKYWKKFTKTLKGKLGFKGGDADPCLWWKRGAHGILLIAIYVDDCLCVGKTAAIEEF